MTEARSVRTLDMKVAAGLVGLGVAARVLCVVLWPALPLSTNTYDSQRYVEGALNLAAGNGYASDGRPTAFFPVGYPLYLAAAYAALAVLAGHVAADPYRVAQALNVLPVTGTVALTWLLAQQLGAADAASLRGRVRRDGSLATGVATVWVALSPSQIVWSGVVMSETVFTALFTGALATGLRSIRRGGVWWAALSGLLAGGALLVRGQALALFPIVVAALVWRWRWRRGALLAAALVLAACLPTVPWAARNAARLGTWTLATNTGFNFWIGADPYTGANTGMEFAPLCTAGVCDEAAQQRALVDLAIEHIKAHPLKYLSSSLVKQVRLWAPASVLTLREDIAARLGWGAAPILVVAQVSHVAALGLTTISVIRSRGGLDAAGRVFVGGVLLAWAVVHALTFGAARYNAPLEPLLIAVAATQVAAVYRSRPKLVVAALRSGSRSAAGAVGASLACFGVR